MALLKSCGGCLLAVNILGQALADLPWQKWPKEVAPILDTDAYTVKNKTCFEIIALSLKCLLDHPNQRSQDESVQQRMQALEGLALFQSSVQHTFRHPVASLQGCVPGRFDADRV